MKWNFVQIQSCRHAVRVLDVADINQRDWHSGQILLYTNPTTKLDHAVLIDFASTTQTWDLEKLNHLENYFGSLRVLLSHEGDAGLDPDLVWEHYGEPDDWDSITAFMSVHVRGPVDRIVRARNMFPYISSSSLS